jgi:hypothetical protein
MTQTQPKTAHKYKPGTTYVFFGAMLAVIGAAGLSNGGGGISPLMFIAGLVLLIVGIAKKRELARR